MSDKKVDVLIIGAGPAGSTAASLLHKAGFNTLIVEKNRFPRFVIGDNFTATKKHGFTARS